VVIAASSGPPGHISWTSRSLRRDELHSPGAAPSTNSSSTARRTGPSGAVLVRCRRRPAGSRFRCRSSGGRHAGRAAARAGAKSWPGRRSGVPRSPGA